MKKMLVKVLLAGLLVLAILVTSVACSGEGDSDNQYASQNNDAVQNTTSDSSYEQPQSNTEECIELTTSNINEYLIFNVTTSDVEIKSAGYENYKMGNCKVTVKTSPKKSVEFQDVVLTVTLETKSGGWGTSAGCSIELPFDGKVETTYSLGSPITEYKSSTPTYKVAVTGVKGYAIKK